MSTDTNPIIEFVPPEDLFQLVLRTWDEDGPDDADDPIEDAWVDLQLATDDYVSFRAQLSPPLVDGWGPEEENFDAWCNELRLRHLTACVQRCHDDLCEMIHARGVHIPDGVAERLGLNATSSPPGPGR